MVELQTISIGLAALSFILAVTYYTFNMRHARETRQAQLFKQLASEIFSKEMLRARHQIQTANTHVDRVVAFKDLKSVFIKNGSNNQYLK